MASNFQWTDLIGPGMGLGGALLGNKINAGANTAGVKENARQFDVSTGRADQARAMLMPYLAKNLGYKSRPSLGGYGATPAPAQQGGGSGILSKLGSVAGMAGMAGKGLGTLGMIGAAGPAAPIAAGAVGAGLLAKKMIGQGRKQADKLTGEGGAQNEFGAVMAEIAKRQSAGQIDDATARAMLGKALESKAQEAMGFAQKGKNQSKVVKQWLGDFSNADWMRDHPELAPIAQRFLGSMG